MRTGGPHRLRPDGEGADQPAFSDIHAAAKKAGIECCYLPVPSSNIDDSDVDDFGAALDQLPKPALAYCLSGNRSTTLWSLSQGANGNEQREA